MHKIETHKISEMIHFIILNIIVDSSIILSNQLIPLNAMLERQNAAIYLISLLELSKLELNPFNTPYSMSHNECMSYPIDRFFTTSRAIFRLFILLECN